MTTAAPQLAAARDSTPHLNWVGERPGRLTAEEAAELRARHGTARRTGEWGALAVALDGHRAAGIAQTRLGLALGVSASHVHDLVLDHLPAGHEPAPVRDWSAGDWVTTAVAARLLDIDSARLSQHRPEADGAALTCKAGPRRVWHAPSLAAWWVALTGASAERRARAGVRVGGG